MKNLIKEWYLKKYPTDELGLELNLSVTFIDVYNTLARHEDFYSTIGVGDSVIRERVFLELSDLMKLDYEYFYELLLKS